MQHAILAGDQVTGATTFRIVLELDAGPTFASVREPIGGTDTAGELLQRLSVSGAELLVRTLDGIEDGTLVAQPQPESDEVSYAAKINVADAEIDWSQPADAIDRLIRGCTPAPGAWTTFLGERFKINSARIAAPPPAARCAGDRQAVGAGGYGDADPGARPGAGPGQEAHAGGRLGARGQLRRSADARVLMPAARPAAGRRRRAPIAPAGSPSTPCAGSAPRARTPTWCCPSC